MYVIAGICGTAYTSCGLSAFAYFPACCCLPVSWLKCCALLSCAVLTRALLACAVLACAYMCVLACAMLTCHFEQLPLRLKQRMISSHAVHDPDNELGYGELLPIMNR
eukprot:2289885-Rhodomonas_salina.1